jgi:hypothetical protein
VLWLIPLSWLPAVAVAIGWFDADLVGSAGVVTMFVIQLGVWFPLVARSWADPTLRPAYGAVFASFFIGLAPPVLLAASSVLPPDTLSAVTVLSVGIGFLIPAIVQTKRLRFDPWVLSVASGTALSGVLLGIWQGGRLDWSLLFSYAIFGVAAALGHFIYQTAPSSSRVSRADWQ